MKELVRILPCTLKFSGGIVVVLPHLLANREVPSRHWLDERNSFLDTSCSEEGYRLYRQNCINVFCCWWLTPQCAAHCQCISMIFCGLICIVNMQTVTYRGSYTLLLPFWFNGKRLEFCTWRPTFTFCCDFCRAGLSPEVSWIAALASARCR